MSPTELAAVLTAIATLIGSLSWVAVSKARKETTPPRLLTYQDGEDIAGEIKGEIRQAHQEMRIDHRDLRDRLVRLEAKLDAAKRG